MANKCMRIYLPNYDSMVPIFHVAILVSVRAQLINYLERNRVPLSSHQRNLNIGSVYILLSISSWAINAHTFHGMLLSFIPLNERMKNCV